MRNIYDLIKCCFREKQVRIQELIDKLTGLKDGDEDRKSRIGDLLKSLDEDKDGLIDGKLVLDVGS